jgi:hypothetical protein
MLATVTPLRGLGHRPETALRIVAAIYNFRFRRSYPSEGVEWTKQPSERSGASVARLQRDYPSAISFTLEALKISEEFRDNIVEGAAL